MQAVDGSDAESLRASEAGTALKAKAPNWDGADDFGFLALPGGGRWCDGSFGNLGDWGGWWSATENDAGRAWYVDVYTGRTNVGEFWNFKSSGLSVRCLRD